MWEDVVANYGLAGVALLLMFKMYMENTRVTEKLSDALSALSSEISRLREDIYNWRIDLAQNRGMYREFKGERRDERK